MMTRLREDVRAAFERDPAARSVPEVLLCYPGLHAIWLHRVSHWLWRRRLKLLARVLSTLARALTGVDIHPGARIGRRFFIDHGAGVVIGETAEVGADVLIYQGVVLGGTSMEKTKRHPTVGDRVVIGAGAILLGPIRVGDDARVGAGSVVIRSVPGGATVVGVPGRTVGAAPSPVDMLRHADLPDPLSEVIHRLAEKQERLERELESLRANGPLAPARRAARDEVGG
ncbi:MAG: serine O-acetyltransferase [Planctomycetota bacterium]